MVGDGDNEARFTVIAAAWLPPLAVSTSVFTRVLGDAQWAALDRSGIAALEIVAPVPQCPLDDPALFQHTRERLQRSPVRLHSIHLAYGRRLDLSQLDASARAQALAATAQNLRLAASLGARLVVVHPSADPIGDHERPDRLVAAQDSLAQLVTIARREGVRLAVECLPRSFLGNTAAELAALVEPLDATAAGVCLDVNHLNLREPDLAAAVQRLAPRLVTLHCSDNDGVEERHWMPGHDGGAVDWSAFLGALRRARYAGPFLYEVSAPHPDPAAALHRVEENYRNFISPRCRAAREAPDRSGRR
jgi:sugar phosphate isomerase/epimerase